MSVPIDREGETFYEVSELGARLGIPEKTLKEFIRTKKLVTENIDGRQCVSQRSLGEFFEGHGKGFCRRKKKRDL